MKKLLAALLLSITFFGLIPAAGAQSTGQQEILELAKKIEQETNRQSERDILRSLRIVEDGLTRYDRISFGSGGTRTEITQIRDGLIADLDKLNPVAAQAARTRAAAADTAAATEVEENNANLAAIEAAKNECHWTNLFSWACIQSLVLSIVNLFKFLFGNVLWLAGLAFDQAMNIAVLGFADLANSPTVTGAWVILRNIANVFFIFIVLYIAISMILQLGSHKELLAKVILIALLINFSAFFTRLIIDVSNVAADQFYSAISGTDTTYSFDPSFGGVGGENEEYGDIRDKALTFRGISALFMAKLDLNKELAKAPNSKPLDAIVGGFGTIIVLVIASFVFLAGAILLIVRTAILIFLIIFSPLAFLAYVFPGQGKLWGEWWHRLLNESFFAPLYLLFLYITLALASSEAISRITQDGSSSHLILTFIHFAIVITLMLLSLIFAKKMGATGAGLAMKWAGAANAALTGTAVTWGAKKPIGWAARGLRAGITAADQAATDGRGAKLFSGISSTLAKPFKYARDSKLGKEVSRSMAPASKVAKDALTHPLAAASDQVAQISGIGVLGDTRKARQDAEKEREKQEKEDREKKKKRMAEERKDQLEKSSRDLKRAEKDNDLKAIEESEGKIAKLLGEMSAKEITDFKAEFLADPNIANALKGNQIDAIKKSDNFSTAEIKKISDSRWEKLKGWAQTQKKADVDPEYDRAMQKLGEKMQKMASEDIAGLGKDILTLSSVMNRLTTTDMKEIINKKSLNQTEIETIHRQARTAVYLNTATPQQIKLNKWFEINPVGRFYAAPDKPSSAPPPPGVGPGGNATP